jgi:hypothetical protein
MEILKDKFNIIENNITNINPDELIFILDNYFENLIYNDEKIYHSDYIIQICWFNNNINIENIVVKHFENLLKQNIILIKQNIIKNTFELDSGLDKLIDNYLEKINKLSLYFNDITNITKQCMVKLYNEILINPIIITFLKNEISELNYEKQPYIIKLYNLINKISNINNNLDIIKSFLLRISSNIHLILENNTMVSYPISEKYQKIINFGKNINLYEKIINYFHFTDKNIINVIQNSANFIIDQLIKIIKIIKIKELVKIFYNFNNTFNNITLYVDEYNICKLSSKLACFIEKELNNIDNDYINKLINLNLLLHYNKNIINNNIYTIITYTFNTMCSKEIVYEKILEEIHQVILKNDFNNNIINILKYCSKILNKDIFIEKYNKNLITRLLFKPNIELEKIYYYILLEIFSQKLLFKTNKIINDMETSIINQENFIENFNTFNNYNTIVTSYSNWDVNQNEGVLSYEIVKTLKKSQLIKYLQKFQKFYIDKYNKKINWYPHFGEIIFEYMNKEIKMLPIQFLILELLHKNKDINKDNILKLSIFENYSSIFTQSIISSLLYGEIIILNKNNIFEISKKNNIQSDYIDIFFKTSNYSNIWEEKRYYEIISSREDILCANINHIIKKENMTEIELFNTLKTKINVFTFDKSIFDIVIQKMITNDYIKINNNKFEKIYWN